MKNFSFTALILCCIIATLFGAPPSNDANATNIVVSDELRAKYKIKPHHEHLSFDCVDCHIN